MLEKVQALADTMVAKGPNLRIAFKEADRTTAPDPEAQHFLKVNETRLGRDFKLYAFLARIAGERDATVLLWKNWFFLCEKQRRKHVKQAYPILESKDLSLVKTRANGKV